MDEERLQRAADALYEARALLITAGAGMGVDSGLPDFRGNEGFWRAYPAFEALGLGFSALANPRWFRTDPELAWGFYGHRLGLYRSTNPHQGFSVLRRWVARKPGGSFVFTSNVDGQFQRAGFDDPRVVECHGSIHHVQCTAGCGMSLHDATQVSVEVDPTTFRARKPLPSCPRCGALLRPAILMFGDGEWDDARSAAQEARLGAWLDGVRPGELAVVECGAGTAIPTVRYFSERIAERWGGVLVRINLRDPEVPYERHIGLSMGAKEGLLALDARMAG